MRGLSTSYTPPELASGYRHCDSGTFSWRCAERWWLAASALAFRLVHLSVQRDHLHLLVEEAARRALSRGVQGLSIRVARAIHRQLHRRGKVFADRYHARALKTPRATRWALRYVLLNARKQERGAGAVPFGFIDACSSAAWFDGFARPPELAFGARECRREFQMRHALDSPVVSARTWLLTVGQRRLAPFDIDDAPSGA